MEMTKFVKDSYGVDSKSPPAEGDIKFNLSADVSLPELEKIITQAMEQKIDRKVSKITWDTTIKHGGSQRDPEESVIINGCRVEFK
jgi:hypothetical protein